ncbi:hypothetical protein [Micromonospora sonneratiae]
MARVTPASREISAAVTWVGCGMGVLSVAGLFSHTLQESKA